MIHITSGEKPKTVMVSTDTRREEAVFHHAAKRFRFSRTPKDSGRIEDVEPRSKSEVATLSHGETYTNKELQRALYRLGSTATDECVETSDPAMHAKRAEAGNIAACICEYLIEAYPREAHVPSATLAVYENSLIEAAGTRSPVLQTAPGYEPGTTSPAA